MQLEHNDEIDDKKCLICKRVAPAEGGNPRHQGKYLEIGQRRIWLCNSDMRPFEHGRRVGQHELNAQLVQRIARLNDTVSGYELKREFLDMMPSVLQESVRQDRVAQLEAITPKAIAEQLSRNVVGQSAAKRRLALAVYEHYNDTSMQGAGLVPEPHNVLMIGPSGSGKTLLAHAVSQGVDVPCVMADATVYSPTGFQGSDIDTVIVDLYKKANCTAELAEQGIVFFDEIDKLARHWHAEGGKSEALTTSVQMTMLRLVEGREVPIRSLNEVVTVDTAKLLYFFGGAFMGLSKIVADKMGYRGRKIGFGEQENAFEQAVRDHEILSQASYEVLVDSLIDYGILPELVGRIPTIVALAPLSEQELRHVLLENPHSPLLHQQRLFADSGYGLVFTEEAVETLVGRAHKLATGTRALRSLVRDAVQCAAFDLLGGSARLAVKKDQCSQGTVVIDVDAIANPEAYRVDLSAEEQDGYAVVSA